MKFTLALLLLFSSSAWARWSVSAYNIRNFDHDPDAGQTDYKELARIIKTVKSDVMTFEEVVNADAFASVMADALPSYRYNVSTCGGFGKQKIAIAYNPAVFEFVSQKEDFTFSGSGLDTGCGSLRPVFLVTLKMKKTRDTFVFAGVHLKAGGDARSMQSRWGQYRKLQNLIQETGNAHLILMGDFNTTGYSPRNEDYTRFNEMLEQSGMWTVSEKFTCTAYWSGGDQDPNESPSILDHIVMSNAMAANIESTQVGAHCQKVSCAQLPAADLGLSYAKVSDHCPVQVIFK
ncbi:MAG: endonuclease/exonuclease/phosphatase family protein [Bacteriovoracaceae bacterium]